MNKAKAPTSDPPKNTRLSEMTEEFRQHFSEWRAQATGVATERELKCIILQVFSNLMEQVGQPFHTTDDLACRMRQYVAANLHRRLTLKDLARFLGYSEKYCSHLFRSRMGCAFSRYLQHLRVQRAKRLLLIPNTSVAEVAEALGFCDQFSFSHFFKKAVGSSPHHFRRKHYEPH